MQTPPSRTKRLLIAVFIVVIFAALGTYALANVFYNREVASLLSSTVGQLVPSGSMKSRVNWSEPSISITLSPGQKLTRSVLITSSDSLSDVSVETVTEISRFFAVEPSRIESITPNQPLPLALSFSIPPQAELGSYEGTVHIKADSVTVPKTLKVTVNVVFQDYSDPAAGVGFQYPLLPSETNVTKTHISDSQTHFDINMRSPEDGQFYPVFGVIVNDNAGGQTLTEWFRSNVDINDTIYNSRAYQEQQLNSDIRALVRVGPVPDYGGGPVADGYAINLPSGKILSIEQSQDSPLRPIHGYSQADLQLLIRRILESVRIN